MIKRVVKLGDNTHYNFNTSPDISYWATRYNASLDEIQKIFTDTGNSISKTLEILRQRNQEV